MLNAKLPNCSFTVTRFSDAVDTIIPFFERYPLEPAGRDTKKTRFFGLMSNCEVNGRQNSSH
jgi:hypothetical protein